MDRRLNRLADAVLSPGFVGTTPPAWINHRIAEGLGSVTLYARNIVDPAQLSSLNAALHAEAPDLIIAIDEEAGDVTRLEAHTGSSRPGNLALGAADDIELTTSVARHLGLELASLGVSLDFAPDADVNSNPNNPVIGVRAFGSDSELVARHTAAWIHGLQSAGVAACAKHFPGHGDTGVDSHHDVPVITADLAALDACELPPFRAAIAAGVKAIMTGHLVVPAIDPDRPATLSKLILTDILRGELGYGGLIVTDAIEMKAVARKYGLAGATVAAITAGADMVCVGGEHADEATAIELRDAIVAAVRAGTLPESRLADAASRVAALGAWSRAQRSLPKATLGGTPYHPGLPAARRALRAHADDAAPWPLTSPAYVIELSPDMNMAIAPETPWGVLAPLRDLMPGTDGVRVTAPEFEGDSVVGGSIDAALRLAARRPLVLGVRDAHRHGWMSAAVRQALAVRPDAIVVEMGVPGTRVAANQISTYGASTACATAAAELLAGVTPNGVRTEPALTA
jgi:beta-N-acetylhexosaminidase